MVGRLVSLLRGKNDEVEADGVITVLDRNFNVFVNHRPIYSTVEYRYRDRRGTLRTRRVEQMNAELVRRAGWQVGTTIKVRYLATDPARSVIAA
ncbi:MAG: hypothetical protein U0556_12865 [Dehalococcoidia bacterium]